ncbi:hypothetical protein LINPERPRIM_LOCUS225, partial [Linum perenne]
VLSKGGLFHQSCVLQGWPAASLYRYVKEIYATLLPELLQIETWNDMVQMIMQKNRVSQLTWCVIIAEVWKGRCT